MSSPRSKSSNSGGSCLAILECLGACCSLLSMCANTDKAQKQESAAREAHNRGDHRDEEYHYNRAADYRHLAGDHAQEKRDNDRAHSAHHGHSSPRGCVMM